MDLVSGTIIMMVPDASSMAVTVHAHIPLTGMSVRTVLALALKFVLGRHM